MKNLMKHFTQITKTAVPSRPILQTVHFDSFNDTVTATDSHRILRYGTDVSFSMNLNPLTLEFNYDKYPDVGRLFNGFKESVDFEANHITKAFVGKIKKLGKGGVLEMSVTEKGFTVADSVIELENYPETPVYRILVDTKYLVDALDFIADCKLPGLITLEFISPTRPIKFSGENFDYLISPIRPN